MYDLWIGSVIAALAVGVFVWGLIFWCVVRYRKRGDELPVQTRFNLPMELLYTVAPFLIVSVLFYYTAIVQTDVNKLTKNPDVTVEVVAFKWNWQFNYRDGQRPGRRRTVASTLGTSDVIPVLVLPTDKTIRFEETSQRRHPLVLGAGAAVQAGRLPGSKIRNVFEVTSSTAEGALRRPLRRAVRHATTR